MFNCLICNKNFESKKYLFTYHLKTHKITSKQYKERFGLVGHCEVCGKEINIENKSKRCNSCRDRTGINNPFFNKHHSNKTKKSLSIQSSKNNRIKWTEDDYRSKVIKGLSKPRREGFKEEQSERVSKWWKDHPEQKESRSMRMKKSWDEGLIVKNGYSCNVSNQEKKFLKELKTINKSFEKCTIKINKKWYFPDVVDKNKKIIIEYFGDFYHCNPTVYPKDYFNPKIKKTAKEIWEIDKNRIEKFQNIGYNVITIWEKDFKENPTIIINQIKTLLV
jgi:G:T-mismatch repair DNA endonuclease (very short patch repair protein)